MKRPLLSCLSRQRLPHSPPTKRHGSSSPPRPSRLSRLNARLPRFLQRFTTPLATAPLSHVTSFLLLHELTAILPLLALTFTFHYTSYLPPYISEGRYVTEGLERFSRYFRRKGWLAPEEAEAVRWRDKGWRVGEGAARWVVEVATAWALVKLLLPARVVASVWMTPWFARVLVVPVGRRVRRLFGRGKGKVGGGAGRDGVGTGATGAGAVPKEAAR